MINAFEKLVEEFTFTLFNRLAALKVMEAHTLHPEIVTRRSQHGDRSFAHFLWLEQHPAGRDEEQEGLLHFMEYQLAALATDIPLFNLHHPYHLLPTVIELNGIIQAFNQVETDDQVEAEIWKNDDVLGWLYESYNNYKKNAHKESGAKTEFNKVSIQSQVYTPRWVVKFLVDGEVLPVHKDREKKLTEITGKAITYMDLEALSYGVTADYLVLNYGDIDKAGEKLQQGAIKLFSEFEQVLTDKITQILNMGYHEVHLITDHGFVLTGILDEADKLSSDATGNKEVHERFIRTTDKQSNSDWFGVKESYGEYNYVYAAKSHRPFKSKGSYGYSHGGFTPQEIIIPKFSFRKEKAATSGLEVNISNKKESKEVIGDYFDIKLQADSKTTDLFASQRKVQILIYAGSVDISSSSIITMKSGERQSVEFSFQGNLEIIAVLLDAETREQLDVANIKKSNARDLGGLL